MSDIQRTGPNSARTSRTYPGTPAVLLTAAEKAVGRLPSWTVAGKDGETLRAVRTTRVFRFKDDVTVRATPDAAGARLDLTSASRVGRNDLGQNPRNLLELLAALERELEAGG